MIKLKRKIIKGIIKKIIREITIKVKMKIIIENDKSKNDVYLKFEVYECTVGGM